MTTPFKALQTFEPRIVDIYYAAQAAPCYDCTDCDTTDVSDSSDITDGDVIIP